MDELLYKIFICTLEGLVIAYCSPRAFSSNSSGSLVQHSTNFSESDHLSGDYYLACRVSSSGITKLVCNLLPLTLLQEPKEAMEEDSYVTLEDSKGHIRNLLDM
ncbi:hypothetical protein M5K25_010540 [Dendrobium thyrsiflorum]|uniref:Uncharacterized protein n=1 Tax=Dendrobium thyrsiflorum TaxID=117978 RepID=A0ABD0V0Q6_DENTH